MKNEPNLFDRAPAIGHEYNVCLSFFSRSADIAPKMSISTAGNFRINILRLAVGIASVAAIIASASAAANLKNTMHK